MADVTEDQRVLALVRDEVARRLAEDQAARSALPMRFRAQMSETEERQEAARTARVKAAEQAELDRAARVVKLAPKIAKAERELEAAATRLAETNADLEAAHLAQQQRFDEHLRLRNRLDRLQYGDDV